MKIEDAVKDLQNKLIAGVFDDGDADEIRALLAGYEAAVNTITCLLEDAEHTDEVCQHCQRHYEGCCGLEECDGFAKWRGPEPGGEGVSGKCLNRW